MPNPIHEIIQRNLASIGIHRTGKDSPSGAIIRPLTDELTRIDRDLTTFKERTIRLSEATGQDLDDIFGVLTNVHRQVFVTQPITQRFSARPTVGANNDGQGITIPAGTIVSDQLSTVAFITVDDLKMDAQDSDGDVEVGILNYAGGKRNGSFIEIGLLTEHNSYAWLTTTNTASSTIVDRLQDDDSYRYRISHKFVQAASGNLTALVSYLKSQESVSDVIVERLPRGPGSIDLVIVPTFNRISQGDIRLFQAVIDSRIGSGGEDIQITSVNTVEISMIIYPHEAVISRSEAEDLAIDYLNSIRAGDAVLASQIEAALNARFNTTLMEVIFKVNGVNTKLLQLKRNEVIRLGVVEVI